MRRYLFLVLLVCVLPLSVGCGPPDTSQNNNNRPPSGDANQCILVSAEGRDAEGQLMDQITYIYDDSGVLTTIENDTNNNGIPDMRSTLTYDDQGNKKTEDVDVGSGFQGSALDRIPDARTTYFYANGNQLQREEFDLDIDEVIDRVTTHRYNDQGWRVRSERDDGADEIIDKYRVYTHDNRGNIADEDVTREPDGIVEYRYTNTYDDDGNRISRTYDSGADDLIDYRWDFTWNCN